MHETEGRTSRVTVGAALALALLVLVAFWPVAAGTRSFFHMDLLTEHLPIWEAAQKSLRSGQAPVWLDGEYCGQPALFHQEAPLFYPLTAPLLWTGAPVHRLVDLFILFHLWLAGFAVFLFVRTLTGQPAAALFGGIAWTLSARLVQSTIWPSAVAVSALLPLLLLGLLLLGRGQRRSGVLVTALAGGLALSAARPQTILAAAPFCVCLGLVFLGAARRRSAALRDFATAAALALALGAPSVLPTAALLPETTRGRGLSADAEDFQPLAHGHELDMVFLPVDGRTRWPESAAYPGVLVYALALSGVVALIRRGSRFPRAVFAGCAAGAVAGLILAFGDAGPYRYLARLPLVRGFRVPERFLLSWSLGLALAAAVALGYWISRVRRPRVLAAACLVILTADLVTHALRAAPTAESRVYDVEPAIVPEVRARLGRDEAGFPTRFVSLASSLNVVPFPDAERVALLRRAGALKGTLGMRYGLESASGAGPSLTRIASLLGQPNERALALASVSVAVLPGLDAAGAVSPLAPPVLVPVTPLPRAFLVPEAVVVPEDQAVRVALSPGLDPRRTAVLEEGSSLERAPGWSDGAGSVRLITRGPTRIALQAQTPAPAVLVLLDSWEKGWRATVDGVDAPVLRADGAFRALRLGPGDHRVELVYVPPGLREGLGLGLVGLLATILAARRLADDDSGELAAPGV